MTTSEIRAALAVKTIEFEKAKDIGLPHSHLIEIYRSIKELQYQLTMATLREAETGSK